MVAQAWFFFYVFILVMSGIAMFFRRPLHTLVEASLLAGCYFLATKLLGAPGIMTLIKVVHDPAVYIVYGVTMSIVICLCITIVSYIFAYGFGIHPFGGPFTPPPRSPRRRMRSIAPDARKSMDAVSDEYRKAVDSLISRSRQKE